MSYQGTENFGVWRGLSQPVNFTINDYRGQAIEGELVVNTQPGVNQYQIFVGTDTGDLVPARVEAVGIKVNQGSMEFSVDNVPQWIMKNAGRLVIAGTQGSIIGDTTQTLTLAAGTVNINTPNNKSDAGHVGLLSIRGGAGGDGVYGSGEGGDIALIAGRSGHAASGTAAEGGSIQLTTGAGGDGDTGGAAGSIELITNNGGDSVKFTGGSGGNLNITLGDGGRSESQSGGIGGSLTVNAGDAGTGSIDGRGGGIYLAAGHGGYGGGLTFTAGTSHSDETGGSIVFQSGSGSKWGHIDFKNNNSNDARDWLRFEHDTTTYAGASSRLRFPQQNRRWQSISGTITTVEADADTSSSNLYTASSDRVYAAKLTVFVCHDTWTELLEYSVVRSYDNKIRALETSYVSSDPINNKSQVVATINSDGVITASLLVSDTEAMINLTATEFKTDTK